MMNSLQDIREKWQRSRMAVEILVRKQKYAPSDGDGFNGQALRKRIFRELMTLSFDAIVETGTFMGSTTGYMSEVSGLPVYSCEARRLYHFAARSRLSRLPNVQLKGGDSRTFLRNLALGPLAQKRVFFYLDAHWYKDLPLREEIEIIGAQWTSCAIMIDDFRVAHDEGYHYDDYGPGRVLSFELIEDVVKKYRFASFAPSSPSSEETGAKRGCLVLTAPGGLAERVGSMDSLRPL